MTWKMVAKSTMLNASTADLNNHASLSCCIRRRYGAIVGGVDPGDSCSQHSVILLTGIAGARPSHLPEGRGRP